MWILFARDYFLKRILHWFGVLISKQAQLSLDWISVLSLDRKRTYHCFKQLTADNGKIASEKKFRNLFALGPNENLLQAVTIEAKAVLLNAVT